MEVRVRVDGPEQLRLEPFELPANPAAGSVRIGVHAIGICGSDLHVLHGHHPFVTYPVWPGHELAGVVEAAGEGVDPAWIGRAVVLEPGLACGSCRTCARGDVHLCEVLRVMGFQAPGGMATRFDAPADRIHALPAEIPLDFGALIEPLAVAVRAWRASSPPAGRDVAVIGAGTIGLMCALVARAEGAQVTVVDVDAARRGVASERFGLPVRADLPPNSADTVAECVGNEAALRAAVYGLRKGGELLVIGVHGRDATLPVGLIQDRELRLQGSLMYQSRDFVRAMQLAATGAILLEPFVSARRPLSEAAAAYAVAAAGGTVLKVLLQP
jgi:L-iditol 2-dehydrogenase